MNFSSTKLKHFARSVQGVRQLPEPQKLPSTFRERVIMNVSQCLRETNPGNQVPTFRQLSL